MLTRSLIQPGLEVRWLHSNILDKELQLYVKLPWSYEDNSQDYPVLFCLDGNRSFPLYSTMSLIFETPGASIKELLIVGIGYKLNTKRIRGLAEWAAWRTHDLTPVYRKETEEFWNDKLSSLLKNNPPEVHSGGASNFLRSIREEVIPYIDTNYRSASEDRGLAGYSYGGLFVLYTLFHDPGLFTHYFAGSPTMWDQLFEYEEQYASRHNDLDAKVFMTAGSNESELYLSMRLMIDRLTSRRYPSLALESFLFDGEGHTSAYAAFVSRALCVLYNKDWLTA